MGSRLTIRYLPKKARRQFISAVFFCAKKFNARVKKESFARLFYVRVVNNAPGFLQLLE